MNKLYFAKNKDTQELYVGMKNNAGFTKMSDLKRSITYKHQYYRSEKTTNDFDFYYIDIDTISVKMV